LNLFLNADLVSKILYFENTNIWAMDTKKKRLESLNKQIKQLEAQKRKLWQCLAEMKILLTCRWGSYR